MQRIWSPESIIYSMMLEYFFFAHEYSQKHYKILDKVFSITLREALGLFSGSMHRYFPTMECTDYHLATICHLGTFLNKLLPDKTISKGVIPWQISPQAEISAQLVEPRFQPGFYKKSF